MAAVDPSSALTLDCPTSPRCTAGRSSEFFCGENTFIVDFTGQQSAEGATAVSYGTSGDGCPTDPATDEGRLASFGALPLTSTTVH